MKFFRLISTFLKRYQVISFFILTFIISWIPWYTGGSGFIVFGPSLLIASSHF